MVDIEDSIDALAKWAAKQPDPVRAGAAVVQLLATAAQVRQEGRPDQKAEVAIRFQGLQFSNGTFLEDIEKLNYQIGEIMGWF